MEYLIYLLLISFTWACLHVPIASILLRRKSGCSVLPPGPRQLPIIGNILALGDKPHRTLAKLSQTYGPLMTLKLGRITTIVISSPNIANEALQKHDQALSSRTVPDALRVHHRNSILWLPASTHWKFLRKLTATQMFTSQRLDASRALRGKKVQEMLEYVHENCDNGRAVDIRRSVFTTSLNLISNTFFSLDIANYNSDLSQEFSDLVVGVTEQIGKPNIADYFPILRLVDPQGIRRKTNIYLKRLTQIFDSIIKERTRPRSSSVASKASHDILDALLILAKENNSELSSTDIQVLLIDFFIGGTDTTSSTVEWAMTELLLNPDKMVKAKKELQQVEGPVQESDISKCLYLQAIVKETFRLHPPVPLLLPRKAVSEVEIQGFTVPKNAQILINIWAIGRDPAIWPDPNSFKPERFLECQADVKGRDFELIPFGAGRRICPGLPLGHKMVHLTLASLIHSFDWKIADDLTPEDIDTSETFGLTLHKSEPLRAIPMKT
ncbi:PREDICTED: geraniol 8-hydroxylase-like [Populus euphratica]|uniref:Geraniol 8-hydroxylase-like n=1 Tax=Populus euphratica TaxID=75702 RepID=A0AAJ6TUQ2_POPEU|nr:PREDICTED: geraniol 8-hydroxylase-like [Populus euphratica]XP_011017515.1 PREDICTED: geraniol 8-hydroxylase-like [Populus euphratica]